MSGTQTIEAYSTTAQHRATFSDRLSVEPLRAYLGKSLEFGVNLPDGAKAPLVKNLYNDLDLCLEFLYYENQTKLSIDSCPAFLDAMTAFKVELYNPSSTPPDRSTNLRKNLDIHHRALQASIKKSGNRDAKQSAARAAAAVWNTNLFDAPHDYHEYLEFWKPIGHHVATFFFIRCLCPGNASRKISHNSYLVALGYVGAIADRVSGTPVEEVTVDQIVKASSAQEFNDIAKYIMFPSNNSSVPASMTYDQTCIPTLAVTAPRFLTTEEAATMQGIIQASRTAIEKIRPISSSTNTKSTDGNGHYKNKENFQSNRLNKFHHQTPYIHQHQQQQQQQHQQQQFPQAQNNYSNNFVAPAAYVQPPPPTAASASATASGNTRGCYRCKKFVALGDQQCLQLILQNTTIQNPQGFLNRLKESTDRHHANTCFKFQSDSQTIPASK